MLCITCRFAQQCGSFGIRVLSFPACHTARSALPGDVFGRGKCRCCRRNALRQRTLRYVFRERRICRRDGGSRRPLHSHGACCKQYSHLRATATGRVGPWARARQPPHWAPPALGRHAACCSFFALQACPTGASAMPEASGVTLADGVAGCTFAAAGGQYAGSCMPSPCAPASFWG